MLRIPGCALPGLTVIALLMPFVGACQDSGGRHCAINADCPAGQVCIEGRCGGEGLDGDGGAGDADGDGGQRPDRGDMGTFDGGGLVECQKQADCIDPQVCFNGFCVTVSPDPDCIEGDGDKCRNDEYCEPSLDGCVSWDVHPDPQPACEHIPPEGEFTPVQQWAWENPQQAPEWDEVMMTPVVVDLSGQIGGDVFVVPAVIFNSFRKDRGYSQDGVLRAVRGDSGAPLFSVTDEAYYTHPVSNIAVGDIDGDGLPEIVTGKSGGKDLICFESDGTFKWATTGEQLVVGWGGPAIANIDGVGLPEIVIGAAVVDADGTIRWHKSGSRGGQPGTSTTAPFAIPVDVDADGVMEIVTGDTLYDAGGGEIWNTGNGDGFVAIGNFNTGDQPEIVVVSRGAVRLQSSINGEILWLRTAQELNQLPECVPNCGLLGPPTVADFDGDGKPDVGVAGADVYIVLRGATGEVIWSVPSRDSSSNITGSAVFDFEGDRRAEVVYADEISLKVLRGRDGAVLYEQPHSSLTACEYPVIADVDGDHNAEIVISENTLMEDAPHKFKGIRVFQDAQDNWVDTRRIWNQHAYHVTNVNENGVIPTTAPSNWLVAGLNNFRQNVQGAGMFNAPDLTARILGFDAAACMTAGIVIWAEVSNRGSQDTPPGVPVSFYLGDPASGGTLLGTEYTTRMLKPGDGEQVPFVWLNPPLNQPATIYVVADDQGWDAVAGKPSGMHSECREDNNIGFLEDVVCTPET
ncbi:MAG TPA: hypothetical protein VM425_06410 [Myxococcota bacterium]|nr:hypothetical protein [Myxococcota bacterium]